MEPRSERKGGVAEGRRVMLSRSLGGGLVLCLHAEQSPADEDWNHILDLFRAVPDLDQGKVLVLTLGGAPDARQRARLNTVVGDKKPRIAVLTPSALARAAGTAISWFIPTLKMFDVQHLERALDHLDVNRLDRETLSRGLAEGRRDLGI